MNIKIEILCDEFYVADSLHELGTNIECGDLLEEACGLIVSGDHYTASIEKVNI